MDGLAAPRGRAGRRPGRRDGSRRPWKLPRCEALVVLVSCAMKRSSTAMAFHVRPPGMASTGSALGSQQQPQQPDATFQGVASISFNPEVVTAEGRGDTKRALLESVGYGVMDPVAYRTFEESPLPPKLRPTTHARVAEGVHSFAQEFLGFPPEDGISSFSESAPGLEPSSVDAGSSGPGYFEPHPKLPGVGARMTVVRLGTGELLFHSPTAPTVELLDMLKESFPAIGPTSKVHLISPSWSPEHWVFVKFWKNIFPSAEVWAVRGPHRRFMSIKVDHDLEQLCAVPESLGGDVEVAVLEGVPAVREALLLHRTTGTLLSADFLMAMNKFKGTRGRGIGEGEDERAGTIFSSSTSFTSSPSSPEKAKFGSPTRTIEVPARTRKGRGRRFRWRMLGRTASLLDMSTLAVFAPFKTVLHAAKGNSADFSARVLSWDVKVFVGSHGQSPLEGPELRGMLHKALARYLKTPKTQKARKKRGGRLLALLPGRRGRKQDENPGETSESSLDQREGLAGVPSTTRSTFRFGGGGGDSGSSKKSTAGQKRENTTPAAGTSLPTANPPASTPPSASSPQPQQSDPTTPTMTASALRRAAIPGQASPAASKTVIGDPGVISTTATERSVENTPDSEPAAVGAAPECTPTLSASALPIGDAESPPGARNAVGAGESGSSTSAPFAKWTVTTAPSTSDAREIGQNQEQRTTPPPEGTTLPSTSSAVDVETRARKYLEARAQAAQASAGVEAVSASHPFPGYYVEPSSAPSTIGGSENREGEDGNTKPEDMQQGEIQDKPDEENVDPFVKGPGARYDEQPAGPIDDGHDPFEEPFFPFTESGAPGGHLK